MKDPDTGKRQARINPADAWIITDVPHLRIVDDGLWHAAKARQAATRSTMTTGIDRARRPKYLFSGLTQCGSCGGGFILSSHDLLTCFNARSRGTCTNRRSISRHDVEARVLRAMRERFFEPGAFAAFCEGFTAELTRPAPRAPGRAGRQLDASWPPLSDDSPKILKALTDGYRSESWKTELVTLDARKAALTAALAAPPLPALHPKMADVFREKATTLAAGLEHDEQRDAARLALRGFLDKIVIPPGDGLLQVVGNVGSMLAAAQGRATKSMRSVMLVAGGGFEPPTFGL